MTATQVFFRFAKEHGYYNLFSKSISEALKNLRSNRNIDKYDSLIAMHGDKKLIVDILLKEQSYRLLDTIWLLQSRSPYFRKFFLYRKIDKEWYKYISKNLNGNFLKRMIRDSVVEIARGNDGWGRYRCRNGYHALNFTFKEKNNDTCS